MYHCKWKHCDQRFVTEEARDDHELAARHWDDAEVVRKPRALRHDGLAHVKAGGFNVAAPDCHACQHPRQRGMEG